MKKQQHTWSVCDCYTFCKTDLIQTHQHAVILFLENLLLQKSGVYSLRPEPQAIFFIRSKKANNNNNGKKEREYDKTNS